MNIALLSGPWIAVPPEGYGGIEVVVSHLAEGLVKRGHDVTVFATGDSHTSAHLSYYFDTARGNDWDVKENPYTLLFHLHEFFDVVRKKHVDIIHNHAQYIPQFFLDLQDTPFVHTLHGAFYEDLVAPSGYISEKRDVLKRFKSQPYVSISNKQREGMNDLNYIQTVYNGVDISHYSFTKQPSNYLAWLGRITPNKGVDTAIHVAKKAGIPLKISAVVDETDREYFEKTIQPLLDKDVEFIGQLKTGEEKSAFLGNAVATLFPIRWHEPFGLVMAESMACGTPVVGFNKGSVPEVVVHGKTGYVVETEDDMVEAVGKIDAIDRQTCRNHVEKHFSVDAMVDGYVEVYEKVIAKKASGNR